MGKNWTDEQLAAIETRGKSLLVAAAAGSGKTAVLVERIIRLITDEAQPISLDQLLVVTFTNAAAAEMRERVGQAIQEALQAHPESHHLYQQSLLINKAQITTLHAFCLDLIRSHFYLLNIAPSFKIMDDIEGKLLQQDVLETVLERYYADDQKGQAFAWLVDQLGGREDEGIKHVVLRLYRMSMSMAAPAEWIAALPTLLLETPWLALYWPYVQDILHQAQQQLRMAIETLDSQEGLERYREHLAQEGERLQALDAAAKEGWDGLAQAIDVQGALFTRLPSVKKGTYDEAAKTRAASCRDHAKELYKELQMLLLHRTEASIQNDQQLVAPWITLLCAVADDFVSAYQQKKQEKQVMDFDDMEHLALALLYETDATGQRTFTELGRLLQTQYAEVMVDEYQDINDLQEQILQAISRKDNLFMVGDIKQSIYGFRMANPQLFLDKYHHFPTQAAAESEQMRIDLNRNFRCRQQIIDAVNTIFGRLMVGQAGDLLYDEQAALVCGAFYPELTPGQGQEDYLVETILVDTAADEEESDRLDQTCSSIALEAAVCAEKIADLLAQGQMVYDPHENAYRPMAYHDVVLLMRSPKSAGKEVTRELERCGIPVHIDSGDGYFEAWEIQTMLALLTILDNPLQDIPLVSVLHAPFVGFTEAELLEIRLNGGEQAFYHCLVHLSKQGQGKQKLKAAAFLKQLEEWRDIAHQMDMSSLIRLLYRETGFYDYVGALNGGEQRQANLRALHDKARQYEQTSFNGLFMFLRFIGQMQRQEQDLEPAKILGENADVVRLMSIHKSKGLEFPVVFVLGLGKSFNFADMRQNVLLDRQFGLGMPVVLPEEHVKYTTIPQALIKQKLRQEMLTEEKRVLYVALTRAREKLILIGAGRKLSQKFQEIDAEHIALNAARSYLDWLLPIIKENAACGRWLLKITTQAQVQPAGERDAAEMIPELTAIRKLQEVAVEQASHDLIAKRFDWQYDRLWATKLRSKVTVTELKTIAQKQSGRSIANTTLSKLPACMMTQTALSAADKGTLLHTMMRHIDLHAEITAEYLTHLADQLEVNALLQSGQKDAIDQQALLGFFATPLGQRLTRAKVVYRELPFTVTIDSAILDSDAKFGDMPVLLQGIIDCLWWENDGWVLVDYKSDRLLPHDVADFVQRYRSQVQLYAQAVEKIWKKPVKECYLYMFSLQQYVSITK